VHEVCECPYQPHHGRYCSRCQLALDVEQPAVRTHRGPRSSPAVGAHIAALSGDSTNLCTPLCCRSYPLCDGDGPQHPGSLELAAARSQAGGGMADKAGIWLSKLHKEVYTWPVPDSEHGVPKSCPVGTDLRRSPPSRHGIPGRRPSLRLPCQTSPARSSARTPAPAFSPAPLPCPSSVPCLPLPPPYAPRLRENSLARVTASEVHSWLLTRCFTCPFLCPAQAARLPGSPPHAPAL